MRILIFALLLSGCATMNLMDEYKGVWTFGHKVTTEEGCFRLWEHKEEQRLWVQECLRTGAGKAAASGFVDGVTFGLADLHKAWGKSAKYVQAAGEWMPEHCEPTESEIVESDGSSGYQVWFECKK